MPGITQQDIEAVEAVKTAYPQGLTYGMLLSSEAYLTDNGEVSGFTGRMTEWLSNFFGLAITPRLYEWDDLIAGMKAGNIHLSGELTATPERLISYHMTTPIGERSLAVFQRTDRPHIDLINSYTKLRYAFLEGTTVYHDVVRASQVEFSPLFVQNYAQAKQALRDNVVDAYIEESPASIVFAGDVDIQTLDYYPATYSPVSLSTAVDELAPLIVIMQKYIDRYGTEHIYNLHEQGQADFRQYVFNCMINEEEKEYIRRHVEDGVPIRVSAEFDNYPISFYNFREKEWQGIIHSLFAEFSALTGLKFVVGHPPDETWIYILNRLERGDCAIISELLRFKDREGRFLWASAPYSTDHYAFLSRLDHEDLSVNQIRHRRVGLVGGSGYEDSFHRLFPDHKKFVVYEDSITALEDLDSGNIDLMFAPSNLLLSVTNYMERPHFKVNLPINIPCDSYFGFSKGETLLCSIINKAQTVVDCAGITSRWKQKQFDYNRKLAQERVPYLIGISTLLAVIMVLIMLLYQKRERRFRSMGVTDHLTQLVNRRGYDNISKKVWREAILQRHAISLLTLDIDNFKNYNDTYGHLQGDKLLRSLGEILKVSLLRPTDLAARLGGEEFGILLSNTDMNGAGHVAENIRQKVEQAVFMDTATNTPTRITISIGVATATPGPDDLLETLRANSDKALYLAKESGRNRVRFFNNR
ncbi:GGDEF domain-containing protein [Desulfovibrio sp. OttesenSCG-928-F20]|nr:GGDEF domain-containing protein [Desulfovibrio sp. OttesenSCG-928-M16]MDL2291336.1 GGDEF domain-containing protein [Desulfovibrio sp. OttesenSCG-928-F20]